MLMAFNSRVFLKLVSDILNLKADSYVSHNVEYLETPI